MVKKKGQKTRAGEQKEKLGGQATMPRIPGNEGREKEKEGKKKKMTTARTLIAMCLKSCNREQ